MQFQREHLTPELFSEVLPLLSAHYREVAHDKDIEFDPDMEAYDAMEKTEAIRIFTAREGSELVGYSVYFVAPSMHFKRSKQAHQDILYLRPDKRGSGHRLISWADDQLKAEGVQVVYQNVTKAHDFGPMLEWLGYQQVERIYRRRLDG